MKNEAREEAENLLQKAASHVKNKTGEIPSLALREGETIAELKKLLEEEEQRDTIRNATREINTLKSEMHEIKNLLQKLVDK